MRAEEAVVATFSAQLTERVVQQTIAALVAFPYTERLSGDDSRLNLWEEVVFQVKYEESSDWRAYLFTIDQFLIAELEALAPQEKLALWLRTTSGTEWIEENFSAENADVDAPVDLGEVLPEARSALLDAADNYDSAAVRQHYYGYDIEDELPEDEE